MQNIKITFSYDGHEFYGSAKQINKNTIYNKFEKIFSILGIENNSLVFSGRTDKHVHAIGQVLSIKIPPYWYDLNRLQNVLSIHLQNSIKIKKIEKVSNNFHARFSARRRIYRYIISTKELTVFNKNYLYYYNDIDEEIINLAIRQFVGKHNFKFFSKKGSDPKTTYREIYNIKFYKYKQFYIFNFCANSYLRSQIRMMISFLLKISSKKLTIKDLKDQLSLKKQISHELIPSSGLYLTRVLY